MSTSSVEGSAHFDLEAGYVAQSHVRIFAEINQAEGKVGTLSIDLSFRLDPLSALMLSFVTFVAFLIHIYAIG